MDSSDDDEPAPLSPLLHRTYSEKEDRPVGVRVGPVGRFFVYILYTMSNLRFNSFGFEKNLKTLCRPACFERICCCFGINRQWRFRCERTANGILQSNVSVGMLQEG